VPPGEIPSYKTLERWRKHNLPECRVLPQSLIDEKLEGLEAKIDLLRELAELAPLLEQRAKRSIELETTMFGGLASPNTSKAIQDYLEVLREWKRTAQDLGQMPSPPPVEQSFTQNILMVKSEEELRKLLELARRAMAEEG